MSDIYAFEHNARHAPKDMGYPAWHEIDIFNLRSDATTKLTTTGDVKLAADGTTGLLQAHFEFDADTSDAMFYEWTIPPDFKADRLGRGGNALLELLVQCRKTDSGADENSDLKLTALLDKILPVDATAAVAQATAAEVTLAAASASTAEQNLDWYNLELSANMTDAERRLLKPGARVRLKIVCHETAGATDQLVSIQALGFRYDKHQKLEEIVNT